MKGWLDKYENGGGKKKSAPNLNDAYTKLGISAKNFIDPMSNAVAVSDAYRAPKVSAKPFEISREQLSDASNKNKDLSDFYKRRYEHNKNVREIAQTFQNVGAATEALSLIPTPITEAIGLVGGAANLVGSSVSAMQNVNEGNYLDAAGDILMGATALPSSKLLSVQSVNALKNLPKAKSFNEAIGTTFSNITPASALPRMSAQELKNARIAQSLGKMSAKGASKADVMKKALESDLPDDIFSRGFNMTREQAQQQLTGQERSNDFIRAVLGREGTESERERIRRMFEGMSSPSTGNAITGSQRDYLIDMMNDMDNMDWVDVDSYEIPGGQRDLISQLSDARNRLGESIKTATKEFISPYKYHKGPVRDTLGYLVMNATGEKGVSDRVKSALKDASEDIRKGNVFSGSMDTSHNSYLTQLKQIFGDASELGKPVYLGNYDMNSMGMLNRFGYEKPEIAKYLNSEIDDLIKRNKLPVDILRPTLKNGYISLPQYGIKKETDSILDKAIQDSRELPDLPFENGGELNYNDYSVSASPDFVGEGYSNRGRNYSPAWGGQFAMGGSMPGAVGFTYARTNSPAPSEGPYAKKTLPSAENGTEMRYYQEGLDWRPKTISKDGDEINKWKVSDKAAAANKAARQSVGDIDAAAASALDRMMSYPQRKATELITGKNQYPSEAMGITNPWAEFAVNSVLDPVNLVGIGEAKALAKGASKAAVANELKAAASLSKAPKGSLTNLAYEAIGRLNPKSKKSIEKGNQWLQDWISHPVTQQKIDDVFDLTSGLNNLSQVERDAYNRLKNYKADVKYYPLRTQAQDYIDFVKKGSAGPGYNSMMHEGNRGVNYTHQRMPNTKADHPRFGSWTSLTPKMNEIERTSTTIHEGTHDWLRQPFLKHLGYSNYILDKLHPHARRSFIEKSNLEKAGKTQDEIHKIMGDNDYRLSYYADPTEIHARTMEIRNAFNINPGQTISANDWALIQKAGARKENNISSTHFRIFDSDQAAADVMNKLLVAPAAVGIGAAAMANQPDMEEGGQLTKLDQLTNFTNYNTKQPGGWLDKYEG